MNQAEYEKRVNFLENEQIMEVDFSDITFDTSAMVDEFYDVIEQGIAKRGDRKWYFLVNYRNTRIFELAWIRFAQRGKQVNLASSLGRCDMQRWKMSASPFSQVRLRRILIRICLTAAKTRSLKFSR